MVSSGAADSTGGGVGDGVGDSGMQLEDIHPPHYEPYVLYSTADSVQYSA